MAAPGNKTSITIHGVPDMKNRLEKLGHVVAGAKVMAALRAGGLVVLNDAKGRTPVLTGNLRRSIAMHDGPGPTEVTVGTDVEYAAFVEFGTSKMGPRPFLRPALDENLEEIRGTIAEALSDLLDKAI